MRPARRPPLFILVRDGTAADLHAGNADEATAHPTPAVLCGEPDSFTGVLTCFQLEALDGLRALADRHVRSWFFIRRWLRALGCQRSAVEDAKDVNHGYQPRNPA